MKTEGTIDILDVGQCGFDGPRMAALWKKKLGAHVSRADTLDDAIEKLREKTYDVVLVNRVLASDGSSGLDVIREIKSESPETPVMLVSDLPEAQEEAVAAGALPGFGKQNLEDEATLETVRNASRGDK